MICRSSRGRTSMRAQGILGALVAVLIACAIVTPVGAEAPARQSTGSKQPAFEPIARVLLNARCVKCRTGVDYSTQGDDRHAHWFRVVRGFARKPVPITRAEFVELLERWEREGASCPR